MNRIAAILLLICLLAGCTMAPKYTRPEAPVPSNWPEGPAYKKTEGPAAAGIKWQDFIRSDQVRKVIELALANNRDLRLAVLNIEKARATYRVQRDQLLPSIDGSGAFTKERVPGILSGAGHPVTTKYYNLSVGITSWEIDFFGRIRSLKDQALELYLATEEAKRSVQIALIADVANACLTLAADRENLRLARSTLESQQETYSMIKRRYDVGASSELDLRQAQSRVEAARVDTAKYIGVVAVDENALNLLAGTRVAAELLPDGLDNISVLRDFSAGLPSEALLGRPDIMQAEHNLKAANANIGAARAAFFPKITLTTSIGTTSDELSGLFKAPAETWSFIPRVVVPIFDARTWAAYDVVKAEREIARTQYEKTIQAAFREVSDTLARRGTIDDQFKAQQDLVNALAESYRLSNLRYTRGVDSYLTVLDSQRSLYASQQALIAVRLARLSNLVNLYKVLGGGA
jgi:multidrug efflux system outer membrane protein